MAIISFELKRAQGIKIFHVSRMGFRRKAHAAAAQKAQLRYLSAPLFLLDGLRDVIEGSRAGSRNSAKRDAQSNTFVGTDSSRSESASTAFVMCFRVTVWMRRWSSLSTTASRKSKIESFKPVSMRASMEVF